MVLVVPGNLVEVAVEVFAVERIGLGTGPLMMMMKNH